MNKNGIFALIVLIIIAVGGWLFWGNRTTSSTTSSATSTSQVSGGSLQGQLSGKWQSNDDAKFTRTFTETTVTDEYAGDASATETGNYSIVNPAQETDLPVPAANLEGMSVIKVEFPKTGVMYFSIQTLSTSTLQMTYLSGNGSLLSFTKMQ